MGDVETVIDKIDKKMAEKEGKNFDEMFEAMNTKFEEKIASLNESFETKLTEAQAKATEDLAAKDVELLAQKTEFDDKLNATPDKKSAGVDDIPDKPEGNAAHLKEYRENKEYQEKTDEAFFEDLIGSKRR